MLAGAPLLAAAALSGCGGGGGGGGSGDRAAPTSPAQATTTTTSVSSTATRPAHAHPHRHRVGGAQVKGPKGPPVGRGQNVAAGGSRMTVTVTHVIDPLTHTGSPALPGTREVGVRIAIDNHGPATYDSTASGDVSLVLSSGQAAPLDVRAGVCETQLVDFESHVYAGDTRAGCVGFTVPRASRVLAARFSPYSHAAGTLTWRVGR